VQALSSPGCLAARQPALTLRCARLQADKYGVPRICFVNKMDRLGANFYRCRDMVIRWGRAGAAERLGTAVVGTVPAAVRSGAGPVVVGSRGSGSRQGRRSSCGSVRAATASKGVQRAAGGLLGVGRTHELVAPTIRMLDLH